MKLKSELHPETKRKLSDAVFVGRLAREDELFDTTFPSPVYYKDEWRNDIQFLIKCLSPIPEEVKFHFAHNNKLIIGSTVSLNNDRKLAEKIDMSRVPHFEYIDKITELLNNNLILFSLNSKANASYVYAEILSIEDVTPSDKGYQLIPGPELRLNESISNYEIKLVETGRPIKLPKYPNLFEPPEIICYDQCLYHVALSSVINNPTQYFQLPGEEVKFLDMGEKWIDYVVLRINNYIYVVENEKYLELKDLIMDEGQLLAAKVETTQIKNEVAVTAEKTIETAEQSLQEQNQETAFASEGFYRESEITFLKRLKLRARRKRLFYNEIDLYTFHVSAKTNLITIIGGMSGTGKSRLAQLYGEVLGLQSGRQMRLIPVSPSYQEPHDVLGYLNPSTGVYHESETGLISLLREAEQHPEQLYMVIFDEMNLSQVEHWFSPFISLLEIDPEDRYLSLFSENSHCVNGYPMRVKIGANIIFVGTVNLDETTKSFSDRMLDRTNVVIPQKLSLTEAIKNQKTQNQQEQNNDDGQTVPVSTAQFRHEWLNDQDGLETFRFDEIQVLDQLHNYMQQRDSHKGVSFRVAMAIAKYLANIPADASGKLLISRSLAFDLQVKQRILTKIQGLESIVGELVEELTEYFLSEEAQNVSTFDHSLKSLESKKKELMINGYAR